MFFFLLLYFSDTEITQNFFIDKKEVLKETLCELEQENTTHESLLIKEITTTPTVVVQNYALLPTDSKISNNTLKIYESAKQIACKLRSNGLALTVISANRAN